MDFRIRYSDKSDLVLSGYCDSDWEGCINDKRSTSRHIFSLGSGPISWSSKKQDVVALSLSEAEHIAASLAACQAVWLRRLLADLRCKQQVATIVLCDIRLQL